MDESNGRTSAQTAQALERTGSTKSPASRFRIIGSVVRAMKRFQSALNPTYEFGSYKHQGDSDSPTPALMKATSQKIHSTPTLQHSGSGRKTLSGRTSSGRPSQAGTHYGHKGNLLFAPLPETPTAST